MWQSCEVVLFEEIAAARRTDAVSFLKDMTIQPFTGWKGQCVLRLPGFKLSYHPLLTSTHSDMNHNCTLNQRQLLWSESWLYYHMWCLWHAIKLLMVVLYERTVRGDQNIQKYSSHSDHECPYSCLCSHLLCHGSPIDGILITITLTWCDIICL